MSSIRTGLFLVFFLLATLTISVDAKFVSAAKTTAPPPPARPIGQVEIKSTLTLLPNLLRGSNAT
jgi:hypothetical protein